MHCQNIRVVFNFAETVHSRNKSHAKFKAFTVSYFHLTDCSVLKYENTFYQYAALNLFTLSRYHTELKHTVYILS